MENTISLKGLLPCYSFVGETTKDFGDYKALFITSQARLTQPSSSVYKLYQPPDPLTILGVKYMACCIE